jgi:dsRNA-specific ribonuclease/signal transduction histidine kinase
LVDRVDAAVIEAVSKSASPSMRTWLALAIAHESYLSESPETGRWNTLLPFLRTLGTFVEEVLVVKFAVVSYPTLDAGDISKASIAAVANLRRELTAHFDLDSAALIGVGQKKEMEANSVLAERLVHGILDQLLGVLALFGEQGQLQAHFNVCEGVVREGFTATPLDTKTVLQETLARPPTYQVVNTEGPDHAKSFRVRVGTSDGREAFGRGRSKKEAEKDAAASFLRDCLTKAESAKAHTRLPKTPRRYDRMVARDLPTEKSANHAALVSRLAASLQISSDALLSEALTHPSYRSEHPDQSTADWRRLALLGSHCWPVLLQRFSLMRLAAGAGDLDATDFKGASATRAVLLANLANRLNLADGIAASRGQIRSGFSPRVRAEAMQAVFGALEVGGASTLGPLDELPSVLVEWMSEHERVTPKVDAKTEMQQVAAALELETTYSVATSGPNHDRVFVSELTLRSALTGQTFRARGQDATSRAAADQSVAAAVRTVLKRANVGWDERFAVLLERSEYARLLVQFSLGHELAHANAEAADRYKTRSLLCSGAFCSLDNELLLRWARDVDQVCAGVVSSDDKPRLAGFFAALSTGLASPYAAVLQDIAGWATRIDLKDVHTVATSPEFGRLLEMATIARLVTRPTRRVSLEDICRDWALINSRAYPNVTVGTSAPHAVIEELEGAVQLLLEVAVGAAHTEGDVVVALGLSDSGSGVMLEVAGAPKERTWEGIQGSLRWQVLRSLLAPERAMTTGSKTLCLQLGVVPQPSMTVESIIRDALRERARTDVPAPELLAETLHDLKNQLTSAVVASDSVTADRTTRLQRTLDASRHLDQVTELAERLSAVGRTISELDVQRIDLLAVVRGVVAEKTVSLPAGLIVTGPTHAHPFELVTSPVLLRSILDNLIKNSIEVLSGSEGTISVEWIPSPEDRSALIELRDTGPGIPEDIVAVLQRGAPSPTTKTSGSGIGLWSVYRMADRISATLSYDRPPEGGARWTILVPDLEDRDDGSSAHSEP